MPNDRVIPNAILPPRTDSTGQLTPAYMSDAAQDVARTQVLFAGADSYIPVIYGGPERTAGLLYFGRLYGRNLLLCIIIGESGTLGIEEIDGVELGDVALTGSAWAGDERTYSNGVKVRRYYGTQTTPDSWITTIIPAYAEVHAGTAYVVAQIPPGVTTGFPLLTFRVKGIKVYDPGTLSFVWSTNPALIRADFAASAVYGERKTVNWASVAVAADYCDVLLGGQKRNTLTLTIADKRSVREWGQVLNAYVPCWCPDDGATLDMVVDTVRSSDHTFTAASIDSEPPPRLKKSGVRNTPTVVEIGYTDTTATPWATKYAEATTGASIRRKSRIEMPGIRTYAQARRFAIERLNHYTLEDVEIEIAVFDDGLKVREGDVMTVTDDIGVTGQQYRVLDATDRGNGRWSLRGREYDPAAFSSVVETTSTRPDTGLPDPRTVAAPTSLVLAEVTYLETAGTPDNASGYIYQSRIDIAWTASTYAYPHQYRIEVLDGTTVVHAGMTPASAYSTPPLQQGKTYTVRVYARGNASAAFESTALSGSVVVTGNVAAPGQVAAITRAVEIGGVVFLTLTPPADRDVIRYEWVYGVNTGSAPVPTITYASATLIDRVDSFTAQFKGLPVGTWSFAVKAINAAGKASASERVCLITITSDPNAMLQEQSFTSPTLTNMMLIPPAEGVWVKRWMTSVTGDQWSTAMANPVSTSASPVAANHSSATSKWVGESWDLGSTLSGDWTLTPNTTDLTGTATYAMETSPDGSTWTSQPGTSWKGSTRYIRPVIQTLTTGTMLVTPPKISLSALLREERGTTQALVSGGKLVMLADQYVGMADLQLTAINTGGAARQVIADRVLIHPETGLMHQYDFNGSGDNYAWRNIGSASSYVVTATDYIEFDVFIDPANPAVSSLSNGGIRIGYTDGSFADTLADAAGYNLYAPATTMDALARGVWLHRKATLAAYAGKTVNAFVLTQNSNAVSGTAKVLYRSILVTDGAGTTRATIWSTGEPSVNTNSLTNLVANIQCGPANSFMVYAFNGSGTQVAQTALEQTQYAFKGY